MEEGREKIENRAKELAQAHWMYIEQLLKTHNEAQDAIDLAEFHYVQAFIHGYKHGWEDSTNKEQWNRVMEHAVEALREENDAD